MFLRILLFALLVLSLPALAASPDVETFGRWKQPPEVWICASFPGSVREVRRAVREVSRHGGRFGVVRRADCMIERTGVIYVQGPTLRLMRLGSALGRTVTLGEGTIYAAQIEILPGFASSQIFTHELLHALGVEHVPWSGHIMSDGVADLGYDWTGVRQALTID